MDLKKKIGVLLLACLGTTTLTAQSLRLKNRVIDRDYYPVDSARVIVKGTNLSTYTDRQGNFMLEGVPAYLDSIEVVKGEKAYPAVTPVSIRMRRELADRFTWFVKAGGGYPFYRMEAYGNCFLAYAGVGTDRRMSRHWAYQPEVDLYLYQFDGFSNHVTGILRIPWMFAYRFSIGAASNMLIRFGAYADIGLWDDYSMDAGERFSGGGAYGISFETGRHIVFGFTGHTGWTPGYYGDYTDVALEIGYRF